MASNQHWSKTPDEIAHELQGTCQSLNHVLEHYEMEGAEDDLAFCAALDTLVFCCTKCEWWCEISEMTDKSDDWICEDCANEGE